jgi:hypothetical protein
VEQVCKKNENMNKNRSKTMKHMKKNKQQFTSLSKTAERIKWLTSQVVDEVIRIKEKSFSSWLFVWTFPVTSNLN